jgi:hypothetical protein
MSSLQAFALGAMVAWTPSLIVVAWLVWQTPLIGLDENISSKSTSNLWSAETRRQKILVPNKVPIFLVLLVAGGILTILWTNSH